jgi:sugar lactone lactonase YvrE
MTTSRVPRCLACLVSLVLSLNLSGRPCHADLWGLSTPANGTPAAGTETNYNKVFRFDEQGNKLPNDIPTSAGAFFPTGIAVGPNGNIYVSSVGTGNILYFNGQTGASLGIFTNLVDAAPSQLAFGPDGNLYVSEYFGPNVRVYDAHAGANFGHRLGNAATGLTSAEGLAFALNGDLLVGDGFAMAPGQVAQIVRVHNGVQSTWGATNMGSFYAPAAMLTQANGDVLVVDLLANYVARVSDSGIPSQTPFAFINPPPTQDQPTNFPSDITFDPDGNIVVSVLGATNPPDNRGALWRYDLNGNVVPTANQPIVSGIEPIAGIDYTPSLKTLAGDFNGDNVPTDADYAKWQAAFGKFVAQGNGADGNGNGVIDAADYVTWRKAASAGAAADVTPVPEPATITILVGAMLLACVPRRALR